MLLIRNARHARHAALGAQKRTAAKVVAGTPKGAQNAGKGGPMGKGIGWKYMPGAIIETGSPIYRTRALTGISVSEQNDELPWNLYPGLNTVRNWKGDILATVDGVIRVSKLPGTEGTADKVFLWVDPNIKDYMTREMERWRHRQSGAELGMDEVEGRFLSQPRWSNTEDREQEIRGWLYNPQWDLPETSRDYSKAVSRDNIRYSKTERELYEQADYDMFYSKMPTRTRTYSFGGKNHKYDNARLTPKPFGSKEFSVASLSSPTTGAPAATYLKRHDRKSAIKDDLRHWQRNAMFGHFW